MGITAAVARRAERLNVQGMNDGSCVNFSSTAVIGGMAMISPAGALDSSSCRPAGELNSNSYGPAGELGNRNSSIFHATSSVVSFIGSNALVNCHSIHTSAED